MERHTQRINMSSVRSYTVIVALSVILAASIFLSVESHAVQTYLQTSEFEPDAAITNISSHDTGAQPKLDDINAKGIFFEKTSIIEFTNNSNTVVNSFMFWLAKEYTFESFKTESGWTGKKTPEGTIIFTATDQLNIGELVKFGIKTSESNPGVNWSAVDKNGNQVGISKVISDSIEKPEPDPIIDITNDGVFVDSVFRIIPEKPNIGSTIRVTGDGFGHSQQFSFYIDTKKIGTFLTEEDGSFMTTVKIPDEQEADRVNFRVIDTNGNEKKISLRLGSTDNRVPDIENVKLTIRGIPSTLHRGDLVEISGTAQPGSAVTALVKDSKGNTINTRTAEADPKGNWELSEPIVIPLDAELGGYSAEISDGNESILRTWEITSSKVIIMVPSKTMFDPGETIKYSGTALPNKPIEFQLQDPLGNIIAMDTLDTDSAGNVEFEHTTDHSSAEGTYTLIAIQDGHRESIFTGLGQLPIIPINLEFDKLNYKTGETAIIYLTGEASDTVSLLIIDPSDQPSQEISITLGSDGVSSYHLDLDGYKQGIYTAVISKGSFKNTEAFTVGLKMSMGEIKITTTKEDYKPGERILILGSADPNSQLDIIVYDPNENEVDKNITFSDKDGNMRDLSFSIPLNAEPGIWKIDGRSGPHFDTVEINVTSNDEEMTVSVIHEEELSNGKYLHIEVRGATPKQTIDIVIETSSNGQIDEQEIKATEEGKGFTLWPVPDHMEPGTYTITASDAFNSVQITYEYDG